MALFYRALSQMIKKQYIQGGYTVELGEEGAEREYSAADIDKKFSTKYEFHSVSPEQDIANMAIGQQQIALGLPRRYVYENTIKVDDVEGLLNESRDEKAEAGDVGITLYRRLKSMADKDGKFDKASGKDLEAEMITQQLEMVMRARAMGSPMGMEPARGGIGAGLQGKPLVDLFDQGGGGGQPAGEEEEMSVEESEAERRNNMVDTLKEAEDRIRKAMIPQRTNGGGGGFSPGIQKIRQTARRRRPQTGGRQLPTAR